MVEISRHSVLYFYEQKCIIFDHINIIKQNTLYTHYTAIILKATGLKQAKNNSIFLNITGNFSLSKAKQIVNTKLHCISYMSERLESIDL